MATVIPDARTLAATRAAADAKKQARLLRVLWGSGNRSALTLASILEACTPGRPCLSGACLGCGRLFQAASGRLAKDAIRLPALQMRGRASFLTLVPTAGCVVPRALTRRTFWRVGEEIRRAANVVGLGAAIIGIEASFNIDLEGQVASYWMVHGHVVTLDWLSAPQIAGLRRLFPSSASIRRPVEVRELDGRFAGPAYAVKPDRFQRESYINPGRPGSARRSFRDTRYHPLRAEQAVELALVEHKLGLRARIIAHGIADEVVERHLGGFNWARDGP